MQIITNSLPGGSVGVPYSQVVIASGGQLPYTWSVNQGLLPPGLTLSSATGAIQGTPTQGGIFSFSIQAADAIGNVASKPLGIVVASTGFSATPNQLVFSYFIGGLQPTAQQVSVSSSSNVAFTANSSSAWISVSPSNGTTRATLSVSVNPNGLAAGVYTGTVTVTPSGVGDPAQTVSIALTVSTSNSGLTSSPSALTFTYRSNAAVPPAQSLIVGSSGAALGFTVSAAGTSWLTVSPSSGVTPAALSVSVNPLGLPVGVYTGTITIFAAGALQVPVTRGLLVCLSHERAHFPQLWKETVLECRCEIHDSERSACAFLRADHALDHADVASAP